MKQLFFIAAFVLGISAAFAQKTFDNGTITYKMTTNAQDTQAGDVTMEADLVFHISEKEAKTNMTMNTMGVSVNMKSLINAENRTGLVLMDVLGQKMAAKVTPSDYDDMIKKNKDFEVENVEPTAETKNILGYTCKKVIATTKKGTQLDVYYTDAIKPVSIDGLGNINMKGIDGLPLEYHIQTPQASLIFKATDIEEGGVKTSVFNYDIPEGYTEVPYKQLSQMSQGM
ncbi:DUF4412 domain-containing protein [Sinomicrobium kalidii]|uniref:DUF4412 domain-containing protein n=1 Tax=Sinomicrobium kalidii TaxID=2900738 RepID=UPI001E49C75D|nr:DUF4412 domain-containing protein [Sinomicrobium kalidii]UGU16390.1 DUF4412 domain-containing protein [Sinomicrobium kalidii]